MKIIITEEQYEKLGDWDIYSQLSPFVKSRMDYVDIKSALEHYIDRNHKMIIEDPSEAVDRIIYKVIWKTIPLKVNVNIDDEELDKYFGEFYPLIYKKYGKFVESEVDRIYEEDKYFS